MLRLFLAIFGALHGQVVVRGRLDDAKFHAFHELWDGNYWESMRADPLKFTDERASHGAYASCTSMPEGTKAAASSHSAGLLWLVV